MDDVYLHLARRQLGQGIRQRFITALDIRFDDQRQRLDFALGQLLEHVLELRRLLLGELHVAEFSLPKERNFARLAFVAEHHHLFAGERHIGQALDFHRNRGTCRGNSLAGLVGHRPHPAEHRAGKYDVAALERARMDEDGRNGTLAFVQARLDHDAFRRRILRRLEFEHFGLQQDRVEQIVDPLACLGRNFDELRIATIFLGQHAFGDQLLLDAVGIGFGFINLVDRHDNRHVARLGVCNRFLGLWHHAVVGSDDKHDNVGDLGTTCAHCRERFVTRGIQEGNDALRRLDVIGADVLGNAACLAAGNASTADRIEQ